jgi:hypothetical protein
VRRFNRISKLKESFSNLLIYNFLKSAVASSIDYVNHGAISDYYQAMLGCSALCNAHVCFFQGEILSGNWRREDDSLIEPIAA